jgi:hypothetical protein
MCITAALRTLHILQSAPVWFGAGWEITDWCSSVRMFLFYCCTPCAAVRSHSLLPDAVWPQPLPASWSPHPQVGFARTTITIDFCVYRPGFVPRTPSGLGMGVSTLWLHSHNFPSPVTPTTTRTIGHVLLLSKAPWTLLSLSAIISATISQAWPRRKPSKFALAFLLAPLSSLSLSEERIQLLIRHIG